jgi:hypothetical protein
MPGPERSLGDQTALYLWLYASSELAAPHLQKILGCICSVAGAARLNHALRFGLTTSPATYTSL